MRTVNRIRSAIPYWGTVEVPHIRSTIAARSLHEVRGAYRGGAQRERADNNLKRKELVCATILLLRNSRVPWRIGAVAKE